MGLVNVCNALLADGLARTNNTAYTLYSVARANNTPTLSTLGLSM